MGLWKLGVFSRTLDSVYAQKRSSCLSSRELRGLCLELLRTEWRQYVQLDRGELHRP